MKKLILVICVFLLLAVVNIVPLHRFIANIKGHSQYNKWEYIIGSAYFATAWNIYNTANSYYKFWEYESAIELYETEDNKSHKIYHNIWNAHYFLALAETTSLSKKLSLLKKSLSNYKNAEVIQLDEETTINKEIVEAEIKKLEDALKKADEEAKKQQEEEEKQESQKQEDANSAQESDEDSEEQSQKVDEAESKQSSEQEEENTQETEDTENTEGSSDEESEEQGSEWEGSENWESENKEWAEQTNGQTEEWESWLNEEQREAIENYSENLERSQQEYSEYYNKTYRENRSGFENFFWNDPFFDNSLIENWEEKKDW